MKVERFFIFFVTLFLCVKIFGQNLNDSSHIEAYELRTNSFSLLDGFQNEQIPSIVRTIYLYKEYTIYVQPETHNVVSTRVSGDTFYHGEKVLKEWEVNRYVVYKNDSSKAIKYDSINAGNSAVVDARKFLKRQAFYIMFNPKQYPIVNNQYMTNGDLLRISVINRDGFSDTMKYFYTPTPTIRTFSLKKEIDTVPGMALYKISSTNHAIRNIKVSSTHKSLVPKESFFEIVPVNIEDRIQIESLFKRFIKDTTQ